MYTTNYRITKTQIKQKSSKKYHQNKLVIVLEFCHRWINKLFIKQNVLQLNTQVLKQVNLYLKDFQKYYQCLTFENQSEKIVKLLLLTIRSYHHYKFQEYIDAYLWINIAQKQQRSGNVNHVCLARTLFFKALIYHKYNQRLSIDQQAKQTIENTKLALKYLSTKLLNKFVVPQQISKAIEVLILQFHICAIELSFLKYKEISSIYKQGLKLAQNILGKHHRFTQTIKKIQQSRKLTQNSLKKKTQVTKSLPKSFQINRKILIKRHPIKPYKQKSLKKYQQQLNKTYQSNHSETSIKKSILIINSRQSLIRDSQSTTGKDQQSASKQTQELKTFSKSNKKLTNININLSNPNNNQEIKIGRIVNQKQKILYFRKYKKDKTTNSFVSPKLSQIKQELHKRQQFLKKKRQKSQSSSSEEGLCVLI